MERSLSQWLDYISSLHPKTVDLGLSRIATVAAKLAILPLPCPVVTVAGTNGKGTTVKITSALLQQQGLRVGCYTSPHLLQFNERITINDEQIADGDLVRIFERIEEVRGDLSLSFFEFTTLAALMYFHEKASSTKTEQALDAVILEVGLGGRLDAVNIVDADIAVITTLSLDHTEFLGNDLEAIGFEKAGICRSGKLAIVGLTKDALPKSVTKHLEDIQASHLILGKDFSYERDENSWSLQVGGRELKGLPLGNVPIHSQALAMVVVENLQKLGVGCGLGSGVMGLAACRKVIADTRVSGRMQRLEHNGIQHIFDVAHNEDSCAYLANILQEMKLRSVRVVFSALADKDIAGMVAKMSGVVGAESGAGKAVWYVGGLPEVARGNSGEALAEIVRNVVKSPVSAHATVTEAYRAALTASIPNDTIVVFGSFYTVAEAMQCIKLVEER